MVFSFFVTVLFILDVIFMFARACMKINMGSYRKGEVSIMKKCNAISRILLFCILCILPLSGCGKKDKLTIAYQHGISYTPMLIMKEQGLIEKYYDGEVEVEWLTLNSGSAINEGVTAGDIDVAAMGIGPFITGAAKGIPYKMYSNISAQPHGLVTNDASVQSLGDITRDKKIAMVNIGSFQHILLAMMAEKELGDAHALDENIIAMSHPDGMAALLSNSVDCQLTTSPYLYKELENEGIYQISNGEEVWPLGNSFIVGIVSDKLYEKDKALYEAVRKATSEAMEYINSNKEEVAGLLAPMEDADEEEVLKWLNDPGCIFTEKEAGVLTMAQFMERAGFIEKAPKTLEEISVEGLE